ncbi:hypothetical protein [Nocardia wallacei]|uniref:hypothetical protein n=1 Tax=Nocardia wallacei TaxID=480035 RepID=UPI002453A0A0|nr:hypothetical protein [Nocardia wallacei]
MDSDVIADQRRAFRVRRALYVVSGFLIAIGGGLLTEGAWVRGPAVMAPVAVLLWAAYTNYEMATDLEVHRKTLSQFLDGPGQDEG